MSGTITEEDWEKIKLGISLELEAFIESLERMPMEFGEGFSHAADIVKSRLTLGACIMPEQEHTDVEDDYDK